MRMLGRTVTPALVAALLWAAVVHGASAGGDPDALLRTHVEDHAGGTAIVAVVVRPGPSGPERRLYSYGESRGRQADGDTLFEIGSVTKVFTALLLADMTRAGEVSLETTVGELVPEGAAEGELPPDVASITLQELATHTSGLPRLPLGGDMLLRILFRAEDPYAGTTREDLFRALAGTEPTGRGDRSYSNFGVAVLGQLLAARAGEPYEALLAERVLRPLGLDDTWTGTARAPDARLARGHAADGRPVHHWTLDAYAPAGGLVSSASDLADFLEARMAAPDPAWRFLSGVGAAGAGGAGDPVRLGWIEGTIGEETLIWHNGGTGGFRSFVGFLPEEGRGAVVLSNGALSVDALGRALLGDEALPEPPERSLGWSLFTIVMVLLPPLGLAGTWVRSRRPSLAEESAGAELAGAEPAAAGAAAEPGLDAPGSAGEDRSTPKAAGRPRRGTFRNRWQYLATLASYAFLYAVFIPWGSWYLAPYWTGYVSAAVAAGLAALLLPDVLRLGWRAGMGPWRFAFTVGSAVTYTLLAVLFFT